jgi:hypothetical protein
MSHAMSPVTLPYVAQPAFHHDAHFMLFSLVSTPGFLVRPLNSTESPLRRPRFLQV